MASFSNDRVSGSALLIPSTAAPTIFGPIGEIDINSNRFLHAFGTNNTFIGTTSGNYTLTGTDSAAVGLNTLVALTLGSNNSALGSGALSLVTSGANNIGIGKLAGSTYTTESNNIAIGNIGSVADSGVMRFGTAGTHTQAFMAGVIGVTVASPTSVVIDSVTGQLGVAAGGGSPIETITGNDGLPETPSAGNFNILTANATVKFLGTAATETLDFGITNLILGSNATGITTAIRNVGIGYQALNSITSGGSNIAVGYQAARNITQSSGCIAIGDVALSSETTGLQNIAIGSAALSLSNGSSYNIAVGFSTLGQNVTGINNTIIGHGGASNLTGSNNTALGFDALQNVVTGTYNIAIGYTASFAHTLASSNNITLNSVGVVADNNTLRIGQATGAGIRELNRAFICGIDGVNVGSVAKVVTMASDQLGTASIVAGAGISVTPGANTITIANTSTGLAWSVITANQTAAVNNGYFCNKAGTLTLALPASSAVGDVIEVANINTATGTQITQAAGQQIFIGNTNTTSGAGGSLTSSATGDTLKLVCRTANTVWQVISMIGNWSIV